MIKIGLTGANGRLGSTIYQTFNEEFEIITIAHADITYLENDGIKNPFESIDVIIHCAADTNVEANEANPSQAFDSNVRKTKILLENIPKTCKFIFVSSTGVYGRQDLLGSSSERSPTNPTTVHHRTKLQAEKLVLARGYQPLVVRTGWLFGSNKSCFVKKILDEAKIGDKIKSNTGQVGNPTFVDDVSDYLKQFIEINATGVINLVNLGKASRFEYVSKIVELLNLGVEVAAVDANQFGRNAPVAANEAAHSTRLADLKLSTPRHWHVALAEFLRNI